jgi:hypothetical protein
MSRRPVAGRADLSHQVIRQRFSEGRRRLFGGKENQPCNRLVARQGAAPILGSDFAG